MEDQQTRRFGRYEIVGELGRGAMGVVYKARDPQIDRLVALKTVSLYGDEPEQDKEFRRRFLYEAQAAGRLQHPGIVSIFDAGEDPESHNPYIVLEYVTGESLGRVLGREKKLPLSDALRLAEEIATALDYAHAQGVVHRDIKPANILITEDGHTKIADLGIAKLNLSHQTSLGRVVGTPAYMAPEQLSGEPVDGRSDLFSLGVILYVMVTGHSPFPGSSSTTVCYKVLNREPLRASAMDLDLPRALDAVISHAMAKDPKSRYQRGADLHQLQLQYQSGATTTSLNAILPVGTGSLEALSAPSSAPSHQPPAPQSPRMYPATGAVRLPGMVLGAALVVIGALLVGNLLEEFAPSRRLLPEAQIGTPLSPNRPGEENRESPQASIPTGRQPAGASSTPVAIALKPRKVNPATQSYQRRPTKKAPLPQALSAPIDPPAPPAASLDVAVLHQFKNATLSLWIDDKLALSQPLHGIVRKHLIVFNGVHGANSETVTVPAGSHVLRLRAESSDRSIDLSKTISADFTGGDNKALQVTFNNRNTAMNLAWQ
jgi:serine/threonine protein kinase